MRANACLRTYFLAFGHPPRTQERSSGFSVAKKRTRNGNNLDSDVALYVCELQEGIAHKFVAISVSTFCSPKALKTMLWVNKTWKQLRLTFRLICV